MDFSSKYSIMNKNNNFNKNMYKKIGFITLGAFLFVNSVFTGNVFAGTDTVINVNGLNIEITRNIGEEVETYNVTANDVLNTLNFNFTGTSNHLNLTRAGDNWTIDFQYGSTYKIIENTATGLILDFIKTNSGAEVELNINNDSGVTTATFAISKELSDAYFNRILESDAPFSLSASSQSGKEITASRSEGEYIFSSNQTLNEDPAFITDGSNSLHIQKVGDKFTVEGSYNDRTITVEELDLSSPKTVSYGDMSLAVILSADQKQIQITPNAALVEEIKNRLLKEKVTKVTIPASGNLNISEYPNAIDIEIPSTASNPSVTFATSGNEAQINNDLTISAQNANQMQVVFPQDTTITGPAGWSGQLMLPKVISATATPEAEDNHINTIDYTIKVGLDDGQSLSFSKPVKLIFPGKTGKLVGFVSGGNFSEIIKPCSDFGDPNNPALPANSECKFDNGSDLFVFTNHFTEFSVFTKSLITGGGSGISYVLSITNVNVNKQNNSAVITFNVNEPASAILKYGTSQGSYTNEVSETQLKTTHSFTLNNLVNGTYYYEINVDNQNGSTASKTNQSFTIGAQTPNNNPNNNGNTQNVDEMETSTKVKEQKTYNYNGIITTKPLNEMNRNELYRLFLMLLLKSLLAQRGITL